MKVNIPAILVAAGRSPHYPREDPLNRCSFGHTRGRCPAAVYSTRRLPSFGEGSVRRARGAGERDPEQDSLAIVPG